MKPPIGIMPKELWLEKRIDELTRAIFEYSQAGLYLGQMTNWIQELKENLERLNKTGEVENVSKSNPDKTEDTRRVF